MVEFRSVYYNKAIHNENQWVEKIFLKIQWINPTIKQIQSATKITRNQSSQEKLTKNMAQKFFQKDLTIRETNSVEMNRMLFRWRISGCLMTLWQQLWYFQINVLYSVFKHILCEIVFNSQESEKLLMVLCHYEAKDHLFNIRNKNISYLQQVQRQGETFFVGSSVRQFA